MPNSPDRFVGSDVTLARRAFERWRRSRPRGARIPEGLWSMVVGLAAEHGVSQASQALRLDYYAVQRRLAASGAVRSKPSAHEFVELSMPAADVGRCQVEVRDEVGDAMRIDVSGLCAKDLAVFVRAVAGRDSCSR